MTSSGANSPRTVELLRGLAPDVLVLAQAGIVRDAVLAVPRLGTLNGHPGVLPRFRGVDCAVWALIRGDPGEIGASVHWVDHGIDTGPIIAVRRYELLDRISFRGLQAALDELAAALLVETLLRLEAGEVLQGTPQDREAGRQYYTMPRRLEAVAATRLASIHLPSGDEPASRVAPETRHQAPPRLRVAIDPMLLERHGPEVCWAWRTLLSTLGFAWDLAAADGTRCDIAHIRTDPPPPGAKLLVRSDPAAWDRVVARSSSGGDEARLLVAELLSMANRPATPWRADRGAAASDRDLILMAFAAVAGTAESGLPRNRHGHLDLAGCRPLCDAAPRAPVTALVSRILGLLREVGAPEPVPRWPGRATMAVSVTHDVDYPEAVRWIEPVRAWRRAGRGSLRLALQLVSGRKSHWHIPSWAEAEERRGLRSAFFFCARRGHLAGHLAGSPDPIYDVTSSRFRQLIRGLRERGFEIGLHASHGAWKSAARLAVERTRLEDVTGDSVWGCRHHYWHLDPALPERTLLLQEMAGLRYDSSIAHERYLGFRRGLCVPYYPFHPARRLELGVLELPTAWMDSQLFVHRAANPGDPPARIDALLDTVAAQGGCLIADVHDYVFDEELFPGWRAAFEHLLDSVAARRDVWIAPPGEVARHWTARHRALAAASTAGRTATGTPA
jgi:hypothetical protein